MEYYNCLNPDYELVLYHHGVKGMKWGVRKKPDPAKQRYKSAKKAWKNARRDFREDQGSGLGIRGIQKYQKAENKYNKAEMKFISEKARYKGSKSAKGEMKTYVKEMSKSGLAGSALDRSSGGRSTRLYNQLKQEKGKKYADTVMKKTQNRAIGTLVGTAAFVVGANVALTILENQN